MIAPLRQFRRAPGRILASVFALALAVGAIGVLAIPTVAGSSLHDAAERDGVADIVVATTDLEPAQIERIAQLDNVAAAEGQATLPGEIDGRRVRLVGLDPERTMDRLQLTAGRAASNPGEAVVEPGVADLGATIDVAGLRVDVVGTGTTLWWSGSDAIYADLDAVRAVAGGGGITRLVITAAEDGDAALHAIVDDVRTLLAVDDDTFTEFPTYFPDGTTPIDADIRQVSQLIGLLGIFAGLVALVLLASTTNTLIAERTREVAIMRAIGGRQRAMRRRLRRIATGIAALALVIGLPFGILISNLISRMVLQELVGLTPAFAVDVPVLIGSSIAVLLGARLVSARAARRVAGAPLATALRDRDGSPFGRHAAQRLAVRIPTGGLLSRVATRASLRRPARTIAMVAQISAAVGAAFLIPTLTTSVNEYNSSAYAIWQWESQAIARDPGLPLDADDAAATPISESGVRESGIAVDGEVDAWEMDVYGIAADSMMVDPAITDGRWLDGPDDAVVSRGFAKRNDIDVGAIIRVDLAAEQADYRVVGLADDFSRAVYVDRDGLSDRLGAPGMANVIWSSDPAARFAADQALAVTTLDDLAAEDAAETNSIVVIFGAIGVLVSGVAALAVLSSLTVDLFERRHELATLQSLGARRRRLRGLLVRELAPLGALGVIGGIGLGALGARGIIASFEASNAIDIGVVDAVGAIPVVVVTTAAVLMLLVMGVVRGAARRPIAVTLRGAA